MGAEVIAEMRHHIEQALTNDAVPARKALLQALVQEIRVEGRDRVVPWFPVPGGAEPKVRALARSEPPAGVEPATWWVEITSRHFHDLRRYARTLPD